MIDTHTHIYLRDDYPDGDERGVQGAVDRALKSGVSHMVLPCVALDTVEELLALHHDNPGVTSVGMGLHPTEVGADWRSELRAIAERYEDERPVAIGEVGIDLYHDATWRERQMEAFGQQVQLAVERRLPVIIHCREGLDETLDVLRQFRLTGLPPLLFHSFTSAPADAERILSAHPEGMFGINGVVTFKNAQSVRDAVRAIGLRHIVLETDAPWLAPVPYRGRRNESSYLGAVRDVVATECGVTPS
ncbi:MAG: TatD family hydrolase, partial [Muribaculaceae bacterium]|nr:TatD family hydrolase [Muribaculaceae bacterium]